MRDGAVEPDEALTRETLDDFRDLGAEVTFVHPDAGEITLVPEYTDSDRREITPDVIAVIGWIKDAFPGAKSDWKFEEGKPSLRQYNRTRKADEPATISTGDGNETKIHHRH